MTLTNTTMRVQYSGDAVTVAFPVTFVFWDADDLQVVLTSSAGIETVWTRGTEYTVTGGDGTTGTVTVSISPTVYTPAVGETLTIVSDVPNTQPTSLPLGGPFPSASVEQEFDQIVRMVQQAVEKFGRALKVSVSEDSIDDLPTVAARASKYLAFDALGAPIGSPAPTGGNVVSTFMATVLDDTTGAAAIATILAAVLTARGDILVRGASAPQRLAKGSTGQYLKYNANDPIPGGLDEVIAITVIADATVLAAGTGKRTFRMPFAMTLTAVRASLATAQTSGNIVTVDINEAGTTIISTKLTFDNAEKTTTTAATAAVISDAALADDAEITVDIDQIGDGTAKGLIVYLIGTRT